MKKLMVFTLVTFVSFNLPGHAVERTLDGAEIEKFLPTIRASGRNSSQTFNADGRTDYSSGGTENKGKWRVEGDQYCSVWPPAPTWACYDVAVNEDEKHIFWIDRNGIQERNRYVLRNP